MTSCATPAAVGELGEVCRRVRALESWWRPTEGGNIRQTLAEADGLPRRQAAARETLREAEDELAQLQPDGTTLADSRWREVQGTVTRLRREVVALDEAAVMAQSYLEGELWRARTAGWLAGVRAINLMEESPG